jgi:hypothetical protein
MTGSEPSDRRSAARLRQMGLAMAAVIVGYGLFVAAIPFLQGDHFPAPPWALYRPIALAGLFAVPAVVAAIGATRGVGQLLIAAGVLCFLQAFISGVTLGFVAPGIVLLAFGATAGTEGARPDRTAGLAGILIIGLTIAAWVSLFTLTGPRCYVVTRAADGTLVTTEVSATDATLNGPAEIQGEGDGCGSAEITLRGLGVSAILAIGAVAIAGLLSRPPPTEGVVAEGIN